MVVDASVVVSNLVPHDVHHAASRAWLTRHIGDGGLVVAPALLLPEIADAIYIAAASTLGLPLVTWDVEQRQGAARVTDVVSPENRR
jgi:predicted nucleic acid-binding protein